MRSLTRYRPLAPPPAPHVRAQVGDVLEKMPLARQAVTAEGLVSHLREAFGRVKDAELRAFLAASSEKTLKAYAEKLLKRSVTCVACVRVSASPDG
jgi:hypothetical protein